MTKSLFIFGATFLMMCVFHTALGQWGNWGRVNGNGIMKTESRSVSKFTQISSTGSIDIRVRQGATTSLKLEAEENILPLIETEVVGNELKIGFKSNTNISSSKNMVAYIVSPKLKSNKATAISRVALF